MKSLFSPAIIRQGKFGLMAGERLAIMTDSLCNFQFDRWYREKPNDQDIEAAAFSTESLW